MESLRPRIAVVLAGGQSLRMGRDKALVLFEGERLIDRVLRRLAPQADILAVSGCSDYGTGLPVIADLAHGPPGPVAGVLAAAAWLRETHPEAEGFYTAPVDAPFLPADLIARLGARGQPAIAADNQGLHPTFAYWTLAALTAAEPSVCADAASLKRLARLCNATTVVWSGDVFLNANTPADVEAMAERATSSDPSDPRSR